ncbi:hypothetical protein CLU79DRAFT_841681 [Phycomyces nitens]|nr:hypothetical protein CLU79DRAFT_841681 [Phycomyces nitens]
MKYEQSFRALLLLTMMARLSVAKDTLIELARQPASDIVEDHGRLTTLLGDEWFSEAKDQPPHQSFPSLVYRNPQKPLVSFEPRSPYRLQKRSGRPPFSSASHNTPAFNIIHVIAGVLGGLGATVVGVTMFLMCRKKRKKNRDSVDIESKPVIPPPLSCHVKTSSSSSASTCPTGRVDRFAIDFCYDERLQASATNSIASTATIPTEIDLAEEPVTPSMQQHRLQYLILQQQLKSQAGSSSRPNHLPPPPYQP